MFKRKNNVIPGDTQNTEVQPVLETPAAVPVEVPKKKKGKKIAIISSISAAALAGGGLAAYHFSPLIRNQVNLRIMKPEKYYVWVNEENSRSFAEKTAEKYEESLRRYKKGTTSSIELKFDATDAAKDKLLEQLLKDPSVSQDGAEILTDIINNIEDFNISLTNESKKAEGVISLGANLNNESLISFDVAMDMLNLQLFMRYPEIKEQWIGVDYNDIMDSAMQSADADEEYSRIKKFYQEILNDPSALISPGELKSAINSYTNAWNDSISDIDRERSEKISIGDITTKYTVLDVDMNSKLGIRILRNFVREASNDKVLRRTIVDKLGLVSEKEYDSAFKAAMKSIKLIKASDDEDFSFKTYIDPTGAIRGFSFGDDETNIFYALGKQKNDFAIEFSVTSEGTKMICLALNANETSKETYAGSLRLDIDKELVEAATDSEDSEDYTVSMDFKDMKIGSLENIKLTGSAELNIPGIDPIKLKFKGKNDTQTISYTVKVDDEEYGDISLTFTDKDGCSFKMPKAEDSYMLDYGNMDLFSFDDYIGYNNYVKYFTDLYVKLGIDEKIAKEIAKQVADELYAKIDDYDDYL